MPGRSWAFPRVSGNRCQPNEVPAGQREALSRIITLGPGDSVNIQVYGQPDMTTTAYVADDGTLSVPLAGAVQIAGLSPSEASQRIEAALKNGHFLVDPHVTLAVLVSRSQRVSVLGQVGKAGIYPIESNMTIFDLLAQAGGALETGSDVIFLLRTDSTGVVQRYPLNTKNLDESKNRYRAMHCAVAIRSSFRVPSNSTSTAK